MTEIQDVTGTAFIVAEYRAAENEAKNPLYRDPIVPIFLNAKTRAAADAVAANFPPGEDGVKLRTRYYDDHLDASLAGGCKQVVILGAGLDMRGVRKQKPGVTYFEIDDATTLDFKEKRLAEAGIEAPVVYIPGNYITEGLIRLLTDNAFDFAAPSFFIWEGNTMYLTRPMVLAVLNDLRRNVASFAISFDYLSEAVIAYATGDARVSAFVRRFADMGAPWHFGVDDLDGLAKEAGMAVVDRVREAELHRRLWPGKPLEVPAWYENYSLCTLKPA